MKVPAVVEWTPCLHSTAPQPAGRLCAEWYSAYQPNAEDLLYALAHTKGEADALRAALSDLVRAEEDYGDPNNVAVNEAWGKASLLLQATNHSDKAGHK